MPSETPPALELRQQSRERSQRERQVARERAQRDAALGRRSKAVLAGDLGPVLKRWVSATVLPVAARIKVAANGSLDGDLSAVTGALESPVFGIPDIVGSRDLKPVLAWCLGGKSNGRGGAGATTYCEDLVLAVMATAISACSTSEGPVPLSRLVIACGEAARETALGQFITQVQGAKAMLKLRKSGKDKSSWQQTSSLNAVATLMAGQVRSALGDSQTEDAISVGSRAVVTVLSVAGDQRHIELRKPSEADWKLLEVARHVKGERDAHKATWASFAMMVLCAAQAEAGLFDLVKIAKVRSVGYRRNQGLKAAHGLILAPEARSAISKDIDKWLRMGFIKEPMVTVPENGDYLTVKHRGVAGSRGPMGLKTKGEGTAAWAVASRVMASTAWSVPEETLEFLTTDLGKALAARNEPDEGKRALIEGSYRRLAAEPEIYLPIFMDFRGRVYTQPNVVTYQGGDMQKSLLCFPADVAISPVGWLQPVVHHLGNLYGHGMDKAPMDERMAWWADVMYRDLGPLAAEADEPLQFYTAMSLLRQGEPNRVACQIDGTCNGLQHLSALFRDETAAPFVNLTGGSNRPADIYAEIARRVSDRLRRGGEGSLSGIPEAWARRVHAAVRIDRKLCKKPVMVLPYGGTRGTIEEAVIEAVLAQGEFKAENGLCPWRECLTVEMFDYPNGSRPHWTRDEVATKGDYLAFRDRELRNHPLLRLDCQRLGGIVWDVIAEVLPRPMLAMQAFRDIAKAVGGRSLEWSTGFQGGDAQPLWVVQAKAKSVSSKLSLKGMHLPGSVRGMMMKAGRDEVDPTAHVSGIVANFIHSCDADHLARTMDSFGQPQFGAIHDCYITRPSLMGNLRECTREAFWGKYTGFDHPLLQPVRLRDVKGGGVEEFADWYALAAHCGVAFPEMGTWEPDEVLGSVWFFS